MAAPKRKIPVVVGPTASGKTALAVEWSRYRPIVVVSADSRQIYRRLDVGTGKPAPSVLRTVPHLGIDLVDPGEGYSAGRFAREAAAWLRRMPSDVQPLVVGGTGFYIRALTDGLFREPPMDPEARSRLRRWSARANGLAGWAARLDPSFPGGGRQRAARTVEVALLTGRPLSYWQEHARDGGVLAPYFVRLALPRDVLYRRIAQRVDSMLSAGWIDEVEALLAEGIPSDAAGLDGVGYREVAQYLVSPGSLDELREDIITRTRRYAKRQETWFRHQLAPHPVFTLDATADTTALADELQARWEEISCGSA